MAEKETDNLYDEAINASLPKEITFTLKEREFLLVGILLTKAEKQFFAEYDRMSQAKMATTGEAENLPAGFQESYEFLRDGALILEALVARMQKAEDENGEMKYDFSKYGHLIETLEHNSKGEKK